MTGGTTNGQGASKGSGPKPPDGSEVVEHLKAASQEIAAAGKAFLDMVEEAVSGLFSAMSSWSDPQGKGDNPRVERIDVEDERKSEGD